MPNSKTLESFIPYRRADLIEMCIQDGQLDSSEQQDFRAFCKILSSYYHFRYYAVLERLKNYYAQIDPDSPYKSIQSLSKDHKRQHEKVFFADIQNLLQKANFHPLSEEELRRSFQDQSLIHLNTEVDFDDFERYLFYYRGSKTSKASIKQFRFLEKEITFETLERVVLLTKFKDRDHFDRKEKKLKKRNFVPGQTYLYYFKNIPKADLEILFPNIKISMTLKDKLLFMIPLFGVGLSTLIKMYGNLLILTGLILLALGLTSYLDKLGIRPEMIPSQIVSLIAVISSITIVLGGFAIKQYLNYKNKWIEFLNDVTQNLFFRSISINSGVLQSLLDAAEEEECKESILAYYHLIASEKALTKIELETRIETWFQEQFGTELHFDVEDALKKLQSLKTEISLESEHWEIRLIENSSDERFKALPLKESLRLLDTIWDRLFNYSKMEDFEL